MTSDEEIWKPVVGYEGLYEVSSHGRMRSLPYRDAAGHLRKGKMKTIGGTWRYKQVGLTKNGVTTNRRLHVLVAEAFLGLPQPGEEIHHIDFDTHNNHVSNLEYATHAENIRYSSTHGRRGKLSNEQVREILELFSRRPRPLVKQVAADYGVNRIVIDMLLHGKTYQAVIPDIDRSQLLSQDLRLEDITSLLQQGRTMSEIARHYGVNACTPYRVLNKHGIYRSKK